MLRSADESNAYCGSPEIGAESHQGEYEHCPPVCQKLPVLADLNLGDKLPIGKFSPIHINCMI